MRSVLVPIELGEGAVEDLVEGLDGFVEESGGDEAGSGGGEEVEVFEALGDVVEAGGGVGEVGKDPRGDRILGVRGLRSRLSCLVNVQYRRIVVNRNYVLGENGQAVW
jgi:hypothetical protein